MRIDLQIPAHLGNEVAADLFLRSLRVVNSSPKYRRPWLPFPLSPTNSQATFFRRASLRRRRSNSAPFTILWSDISVRASRAGRMATRRERLPYAQTHQASLIATSALEGPGWAGGCRR